MPLYNGNNKITKIYYGGTKIGKIYFGANKVFDSNKDLGSVTINTTGDYGNNYYCNAKAYIVDYKYLKITGKWLSKGEGKGGAVRPFDTNIFVGKQKSVITFDVQCYGNTIYDTGTVSTTYKGFVGNGTTVSLKGYSNGCPIDSLFLENGYLYLPMAHENVYNTFNQYDKYQVLIPLDPA